MQSSAKTVEEYMEELPEDRKEAVRTLRNIMLNKLPQGFSEEMSYGMIGYVVPHSLYPAGYHCNTILPLPFITIGSQKNFIALHHMGIYAEKELVDWFVSEYPIYSTAKLDMGKGCIRFKNPDKIPFELISELASKMTAEEWIASYERNFKKK